MAKSYIRLERYALFDRFRNLEERDVDSLDWIRSSTIQISRDPWHGLFVMFEKRGRKIGENKARVGFDRNFFFPFERRKF